MFNSVEKIYLNNEFIYYLCILQDGKKMSVPLDEANTDYQAIHGMDCKWWNSNR
jgi:hypothetical protein